MHADKGMCTRGLYSSRKGYSSRLAKALGRTRSTLLVIFFSHVACVQPALAARTFRLRFLPEWFKVLFEIQSLSAVVSDSALGAVEAVLSLSDQGQTARAVAGCPLVTLFSVVPSRMCNGVKIALNLGSSDSFGLRCEETGKARLPARNPTTIRQQIVRCWPCAPINACPRDG